MLRRFRADKTSPIECKTDKGNAFSFQEPRAAADVEAMLSAYSACIADNNSDGSGTGCQRGAAADSASTGGGGGTTGSAASSGDGARAACGAVALAVVGGKMAEGINFGDGLGRWRLRSLLCMWTTAAGLLCSSCSCFCHGPVLFVSSEGIQILSPFFCRCVVMVAMP